MLEIRNTWQAATNPGLDSDYFDQLTLADVPLMDTHLFDARNAWWLAELSRLIYRRSVGEDGVVLPDRRTLLAAAGHTEVAFASGFSTQAAIIDVGDFHVLAFRGTQEPRDWVRNLDLFPDGSVGIGRAPKGFVAALNEVWTPIHAKLREITGPIFYTGHSLGAALAVLAAARIEPDRRPRAVYTYGCPRCGDSAFAMQHPLRDRIHRVVNNRDGVPTLPLGYVHTGELRYITSDHKLLINPPAAVVDHDKDVDDDSNKGLLKGDWPEWLADHAPVNYVAWMQRIALGVA